MDDYLGYKRVLYRHGSNGTRILRQQRYRQQKDKNNRLGSTISEATKVTYHEPILQRQQGNNIDPFILRQKLFSPLI
jgi:hypothetical protein